MISCEDILARLPTLETEELEKIKVEIGLLLQLEGSSYKTLDDWLLKGIFGFLEDQGLVETVPAKFSITNRHQYRGYIPKAKKIRSTFEAIPNLKLTRVDKLALGSLLARCLGDYIKDFMGLSLANLLNHAELVIPAFDRAFPGYLAAGMVGVALRGAKSLSRVRSGIVR